MRASINVVFGGSAFCMNGRASHPVKRRCKSVMSARLTCDFGCMFGVKLMLFFCWIFTVAYNARISCVYLLLEFGFADVVYSGNTVTR